MDAYLARRPEVLHGLPLIATLLAAAEKDAPHGGAVDVLEGTLWDIAWVDVAHSDPSLVDGCRKVIGGLLELFGDPELEWLRDPGLARWAVLASLRVEQTAQARGVRGFFRSGEADLLRALEAECAQRASARRPFAANLADRLRSLESRGVYVNPDLYAALDELAARS